MYEISRIDAGMTASPQTPQDQRYYIDPVSASPQTPLSPVLFEGINYALNDSTASPPHTPLSSTRFRDPQSPLTPVIQSVMHSPEPHESPIYKSPDGSPNYEFPSLPPAQKRVKRVIPSGPSKFQEETDVDDRKEALVNMLLTCANIDKNTLLGQGQESSVYGGLYDDMIKCAWKLIIVKSGKFERSGRGMYVFDVVPKLMEYYSRSLKGLSATIMPKIYNLEQLRLENIDRSHHPFYGCMHAVELLQDIIDKAGASESLLTKYSSPMFDTPKAGMFATMFGGNAAECKDRFADFSLVSENRLVRDHVDQNIIIEPELWRIMQTNSGKWSNRFDADQVKCLFNSIWRPGLYEYDPDTHVFIFDLHTQNLMVRSTIDKKCELVLSDYVVPLEVVPASDYEKNGTITPEGMDEIRPAVTRHRVSRILFILALYGIISPTDADSILEYFKDDMDLMFPTTTPLFSPETMY